MKQMIIQSGLNTGIENENESNTMKCLQLRL